MPHFSYQLPTTNHHPISYHPSTISPKDPHTKPLDPLLTALESILGSTIFNTELRCGFSVECGSPTGAAAPILGSSTFAMWLESVQSLHQRCSQPTYDDPKRDVHDITF